MRISPVNPGMIDLVLEENGSTVYYMNKPLLTPGGKPLRSASTRILKQMVIECCLAGCITDEKIFIYALEAFSIDYLQEGRDPFLENISALCEQDPFLLVRQGKMKAGDIGKDAGLHALPESNPILFNMIFWGISGILEPFSLFTLDFKDKVLQGKPVVDWQEFMKEVYTGLPEHQKSVVNLISFTHGSGVVLPVMLACGYINGMEYVNGLSAVQMRAQAQVRQSPFNISPLKSSGEDFLSQLPSILEDVRNSVGYLVSFNTLKMKGINAIIEKGEGHDLEFKSTLRWDIRAGKTNQQVERAVLKTVSAFLNSNGGVLLIGVRDDGSIEGIETDKFPNNDKFLLHFWTLVRTCFGTDVSPNISAELEESGGKTVCVVRCSRSSRPVFLKQPGFEEEFYVRVGPGTIALAVSEALKYISDHFGK
jgi:hypothetical protein